MFQYRTIFLLIFAESRMILSESAPAGAGVKERNHPACGMIYSFRNVAEGGAIPKHKENFAVCGRRQGLRALDGATF